MKRISGMFLRARHWQIFLLLGGTYLVAQIAILTEEVKWGQPPDSVLRIGLITEAFMAPCILLTACWLWSMGSFLNSVLKPELKLRGGFFRFAVVFVTLYLLTGIALFLSQNPRLNPVVIALQLFSIVCMFYAISFVAKCLATKKLGEPVVFRDFTEEFFLLFFAPIGIWLIQPRINQLYAESARSR